METTTSEFEKYRDYLMRMILGGFTRRGVPQREFARRGLVQEILDEERLVTLIKLLLCDKPRYDSWDPRKVLWVAQKIRGLDKSHQFSNVFAILLYFRAREDTFRSILSKLASKRLDVLFADSDLPIDRESADRVLGDDGEGFFTFQFPFCPVVLKEGDESVYKGHRASCPLPFCEEPRYLNEGASAKVYKVRIEKGHLNNEKGNRSNSRPEEVAQKKISGYDPKGKATFEREVATVQSIIKSPKKNENILTTLAIIEKGESYSLFYPLASFDLGEYFNRPAEVISDLKQKRHIFGQAAGLASGLAHLHTKIIDKSSGDQISCYHLDLKPENVLLFEGGGGLIWKISDFGFSKIKRKTHAERGLPRPEASFTFPGLTFRSGKRCNDPSSGVENPFSGFTYSAPEAKASGDKVTQSSDVWSLGCIIVLTLVFLDGGSASIKNFEKCRIKGRDYDRFFDSNDNGDIVLHESVEEKLKSLVRNAKNRSMKQNSNESIAVNRSSDLLVDNILRGEQDKRFSAEEIETKLRSIQQLYSSKDPNSLESNGGKIKFGMCFKRRKNKKKFNDAQSDTKPSRPWSFGCSSASQRSQLSFNGKYLAAYSDRSIKVSVVKEIQDGLDASSVEQKPPSGASWGHLSLGSDLLCAIVVSHSLVFQCSYIPLPQEEEPEGPNIRSPTRIDVLTKISSRIVSVALSPDDQNTAFVLKKTSRRFKEATAGTLTLAIYDTQDIVNWVTQRAESSSHSSKSNSLSTSKGSISFPASESCELPWKCKIVSAHERQIPSNLVDLKFTKDSKILVAITEQYENEPKKELGYQYEIMSWDTTTGRRLPNVTQGTKGSDYTGSSWVVSAFALSPDRADLAAITNKKVSWGSYGIENSEDLIQSKVTSDLLLDVLVHPEQDEVIVIGQSNGRGEIKIFRIAKDSIPGLQSLGDGVKTGLDVYSRITGSCAWVDGGEHEGLSVLIANVDSRRGEGKLCQTFLA